MKSQSSKLYIDVVKALLNHSDRMVTIHTVDPEAVSDAFQMATDRLPEVLGVRSISCSTTMFWCRVCIQYTEPRSEWIGIMQQVDEGIEKLFSPIMGLNEYSKVLRVHDWLAENVTYTTEGVPESMAQAFLKREANCVGFSKLAKRILDHLGVRSTIVLGESRDGKGHAWNLVRIDGKWYHNDFTYDQNLSVYGLNYSYNNLTDAQILRDHDFDGGMYPRSSDRDLNWYRINGLDVCCWEELEVLLAEGIRSGFSEMRLSGNIGRSLESTVKDRVGAMMSRHDVKSYLMSYSSDTRVLSIKEAVS